jgi:hypothetical protein
MAQQLVLRGGTTAAHLAGRTSDDSILGIANRVPDLIPLRRDQKLLPHFGEAGTAVFTVEQVEYGGHDLTSLFDLHHPLQAIIFVGGQRVN